jgi:hypothetical protein
LNVARKEQLPTSWLNEQASVYLPPGFEPSGDVVFHGRALTVRAASAELLLAMKVSAFRRTDIRDVVWLTQHLGLGNQPDAVVALTERVMGSPLNAQKVEAVHEVVGSYDIQQTFTTPPPGGPRRDHDTPPDHHPGHRSEPHQRIERPGLDL